MRRRSDWDDLRQVDLRLNPEDWQQSPGLNHTLIASLLETTPFAAQVRPPGLRTGSHAEGAVRTLCSRPRS